MLFFLYGTSKEKNIHNIIIDNTKRVRGERKRQVEGAQKRKKGIEGTQFRINWGCEGGSSRSFLIFSAFHFVFRKSQLFHLLSGESCLAS